MAFLQTSDIIARLNSDDVNEITAELLIIEAELRYIGFIFEINENQETRWVTGVRGQKLSIFDIGIVSNIESIIITEPNKTDGDILTADTDYYLTAVRNAPNSYFEISLEQRIEYPESIRITGMFGLYIDFEDESEIGPKLMTNAIISYINARIAYAQNEIIRYQNIKRAKTGDSDVTYATGEESNDITPVESILANREMKQAIRHYIDV